MKPSCKFQIPDVKTGNDRVDAVVVDEEAIGSVQSPGCGAKILRGDGALESYISKTKSKDPVVRYTTLIFPLQNCIFVNEKEN